MSYDSSAPVNHRLSHPSDPRSDQFFVPRSLESRSIRNQGDKNCLTSQISPQPFSGLISVQTERKHSLTQCGVPLSSQTTSRKPTIQGSISITPSSKVNTKSQPSFFLHLINLLQSRALAPK